MKIVATEQYDCLILGSGQAGGPLATALANAGRKTAIVERVHVGGTCINEGCTPTKTMVASARVAYLARRGGDYGVDVGHVTVDMRRVRQRKREIVDSFRGGSERRLEGVPNLDLIYGEARFTGPKAVQIMLPSGDKRELTAETIFINTGERPADPNVPGLDPARTLNSTSIMELDVVPSHLLVIGGGYVGLEFAQMFRRFGSQVTIIQRGRQLLGREDGDVAEAVAQILAEDGIEILLNSSPTAATTTDTGVTLRVKTPDGAHDLTGSHVLAAAGRVPNTEALNLAAAGVANNERGYIRVNELLETSAPGIYALGDVKGPPAFTHISYDDFRIIRTNLLEGGNATTTDRLVPYTVFIDPQLGRVGLSEEEARQQGRNIKVAKMPMSWVARADEVDEARGFMKAVVDAGTRQILGCAILGIEGGELMAMVEIAMLGGLPYTVLRDAVFAHPTLAESLNNLFTNFDE
ncbi:MAG TPA: mercuric reductase [Ktedonobacterales bacterium]|jgi:pyruvate/2-oxoglutarate dehydrogenase complex dihydrolipoamide dehydrogenase (E3) component